VKDIKDKLFCALQYLLPQHLLSRSLARLADTEIRWLKNLLIRSFIRHYQVDQNDTECEDIGAYTSFNHFFTRALKPNVRPIADSVGAITSPADGTISQCGKIAQGNLLQAKGHVYSTADLVGDESLAAQFHDGEFFTIYLSPKDYHRVHSPIMGTLIESRYIPGRLFSVNSATTAQLPGLFARNERLVCVFESQQGPVVVVMVGAMLVAGIETIWQTKYLPNIPSEDKHIGAHIKFAKGEEIGRFKFGSTVIVLLPNHTRVNHSLEPGTTVKMGENVAGYSADRSSNV